MFQWTAAHISHLSSKICWNKKGSKLAPDFLFMFFKCKSLSCDGIYSTLEKKCWMWGCINKNTHKYDSYLICEREHYHECLINSGKKELNALNVSKWTHLDTFRQANILVPINKWDIPEQRTQRKVALFMYFADAVMKLVFEAFFPPNCCSDPGFNLLEQQFTGNLHH